MNLIPHVKGAEEAFSIGCLHELRGTIGSIADEPRYCVTGPLSGRESLSWIRMTRTARQDANSVTRTFHTGTDYIILSPRSVTTLLSAVGKRPNPPSKG